MSRRKTNYRRDKRIFAKTANRIRQSNVTASNAMRGGLMR